MQVCDRLRCQDIWGSARNILLFAPLADEPDIWPLLNEALSAGKSVALPAFVPGTNGYTARQIVDLDRDVTTGKFGIREPSANCPGVPLNQLDLVLVPGLAFDRAGWRLGRGRGFYDRLLAKVAGVKCGVAFDLQVLGELPIEAHDQRVNFIVTPTEWIEARWGRKDQR